MKKLIYILLFPVFCTTSFYAQSGWYPLTSGSTASFNSCYFTDLNTGYLAADSGRVFKTTNGGANWNMQVVDPIRYLTSIYFTDVNTGYICGDSGYVIKTTNAGSNWNQLFTNSDVWLLRIRFIDASTGFIGCQSGTLLKTTNAGLNWLLLNKEITYPIRSFYFINTNTGYLVGGTFDLMGMIYKTTNSGLNWVNQFITNEPINSVYFINDNIGFAAGGDFEYGSTLFGTTNGGANWNQILDPPPFGPLSSIKFIGTDTGYAVGLGKIIKTTNGGLNWHSQYTDYTNYSSISMLNAMTGYVCGGNGVILKTTTGGDTINYLSISGQISYRDNNQPVNAGYVKALHFDSTTLAVTTLDSAQIQSGGAYLLSRIPPHVSTDIMAFENDEENLNFVPTYYPSTTNWQNATTLNLSSSETNIDILVYRINSSGGLMHIGGHVYKQSQNPQPSVDGAIIYAKIGEEYKGYSLANSSGAYRVDSLSSGNYTLFAERIGYNQISRDVVLTNFSKDSIDFVLDNSLIGVNTEGSVIPKNFWLGNSYPNPFNPSVTIKFGLPKTSISKIIIYDVLGREIAILVNEMLKSGIYSVNWNASNFSSGVYFYRIESGDYIETKKMVLLK